MNFITNTVLFNLGQDILKVKLSNAEVHDITNLIYPELANIVEGIIALALVLTNPLFKKFRSNCLSWQIKNQTKCMNHDAKRIFEHFMPLNLVTSTRATIVGFQPGFNFEYVKIITNIIVSLRANLNLILLLSTTHRPTMTLV